MNEQLLSEHMRKMQPYFLKWHRNHATKLLTSPLKTLQYQIKFGETFAPPEELLCQSYLYSISEAYRELASTYYYAQAAFEIESELREEGEISWSNYWKYEMKNYYIRTVIPRIISLLDYVAVMINELSKRRLIRNERQVYFNKIKSSLEKADAKVGWLSIEELKELNDILSLAYKGIQKQDKDFLRDYRDKTTHNYFVGIDEITIPIQRRSLSEQDKKMLETREAYVYRITGRPEYAYSDLVTSAERLLTNLDDMLFKLMQMDRVKNMIKKN